MRGVTSGGRGGVTSGGWRARSDFWRAQGAEDLPDKTHALSMSTIDSTVALYLLVPISLTALLLSESKPPSSVCNLSHQSLSSTLTLLSGRESAASLPSSSTLPFSSLPLPPFTSASFAPAIPIPDHLIVCRIAFAARMQTNTSIPHPLSLHAETTSLEPQPTPNPQTLT